MAPDTTFLEALGLLRSVSSPIISVAGLLVNLFCITRLSSMRAEGSALRTHFFAMLICSLNLIFIALDHLSVQMMLQQMLGHESVCSAIQVIRTSNLLIETWLIAGVFLNVMDPLKSNALFAALVVSSTIVCLVVEAFLSTHVVDEKDVLVCVRTDNFAIFTLHGMLVDLMPLSLICVCLFRILVVCRLRKLPMARRLVQPLVLLAFVTFLVHLPFWLQSTGLFKKNSFSLSLYMDTVFVLSVQSLSWVVVPILILKMQNHHVKLVNVCHEADMESQLVVVELDELEPPTFSHEDRNVRAAL